MIKRLIIYDLFSASIITRSLFVRCSHALIGQDTAWKLIDTFQIGYALKTLKSLGEGGTPSSSSSPPVDSDS